MNDATFADCRVECGRQHFSPTSYCQLNITYRCGEISIGYYVTIIRERNSVVDRSRREEKVRKERRRKKKKGNEFFVMVRATSVIRVKNRYESARVLPLSPFPPPPPIESISCALRLSRISFIVQRQNKSTLV